MKKGFLLLISLSMLFNIFFTTFADNVDEPSSWAKASIDKANEIGIIPDDFSQKWSDNITNEEFCILAFHVLEKGTGLELSKAKEGEITEVGKQFVISLYRKGIIKARADGSFHASASITREEAATILDRMAKYCNIKADVENFEKYSDDATISEWAKGAVYNMLLLDIMNGINGGFSPKGKFTIEQSIVTLVRLFDLIPQNPVPEAFADKLNPQIPRDKNYMFSPLSIKMALAMAANGADGETKDELLKTLHIQDLDSFNIYSKEMLKRYSNADVITLNIANSIWINESQTTQNFSDTFKNKISEFYNGKAQIVNNLNAVNTINNWVNFKTNGKIPTIIEDSGFDAALVNAVYFKGTWLDVFKAKDTKKDIFTDRNGEKSEIDFMNIKKYFAYCDDNGTRVVNVPYKQEKDMNISMYLILSNEDIDFNAFLKANSGSFKQVEVCLSLPKFKIEYDTSLLDMLQNIGIRKAFDLDAQFEKMYDKGSIPFIKALHKTYINVDEQGTEAAAVTFLGAAGSALNPLEPIEFKLDRPFTFIIRDNINGEILFMGEYAYAE